MDKKMKNKDLLVLETNDYKVELKITGLNKEGYTLKNQKQFNDYTWKEIQEMVKSGNHNFKVGDIKTINFRDREHEIVIIGVNNDGDNTITCQFRDVAFDMSMNEEPTNKGGFVNSDLYIYLNTEFIRELNNALGISIESNIFLPSEFEVFGEVIYSEKEDDDEQYEYFKEKRNRIKYDFENENTTRFWWLRSAYSDYSNYFVIVYINGLVSNNFATNSNGVSPCFII